MRVTRDDALRKRLRVRYARLDLPCGICHQPIDWTLRHPHPLSGVVDHIIPIARGGADHESNCQSAHRSCNRAKGDRLPTDDSTPPKAPRIFVTHRTWKP